MHVGLSLHFQNLGGTASDAQIVREQLELADLAEPMGFDSVWAPEHHFTNYVMVPSTVQFLTWVGARTSRIQLGSMVTVLPWNDPIRLAEQWGWLDHATGGRSLLGIGRGLGRVEFDNFGLQMGESRVRFVEYADAILTALETGFIEYDGELYKQRRAAIRPLPAYSFRGRVYASAVSPESARIMARLGVGLLIIAQKPWQTTLDELNMYRAIYEEINGEPAPKPLLVSYTVVDRSEARAQEMFEQYLVAYAGAAADHYEFANVGLAEIPGYEYYGRLAQNIEKHGLDKFARFLADLQVAGTPDQVLDKIVANHEAADLAGVIIAPAMGGMPADVARANVELFVSDVLPRLKAVKTNGSVGRVTAATVVAEARSTPRVTEHIVADPVPEHPGQRVPAAEVHAPASESAEILLGG